MKLLSYFNSFLIDTVNLSPSKLDDLDERVPTLTEVVKGGVRETTVLDAIPQGSWAHRTIIQPGAGLEFDADFLLQLDEVDGWAPTDYTKSSGMCSTTTAHMDLRRHARTGASASPTRTIVTSTSSRTSSRQTAAR